MKRLLLFLAVMFCGAALALAQTAQQLAAEGQRAFMAKDFDTAKVKFMEALALDPSNKAAIGYLRMIRAHEAKTGGENQLEKQLQELVLPEVRFKDATFADALEYLRQQAQKREVSVSFVIQTGVNSQQPVTLNLAQVPFTEALRYLCELGGARYSIDRYAVVIKPL